MALKIKTFKRTPKNRILKQNQNLKNVKSESWSLVSKKLTAANTIRHPYEQRWLINLAFFASKQYCWFDTGINSLYHLPPIKNKVRLVDNQLLPKVRRQISNAIRTNPSMSVVPNSNDDEDIKAAKIGTKVLKHFWRENRMKSKIRLANTWRFITGNVYMDDRWNKKLGPTEVDKKTGNLVYLGDADCGIWSPFEIGVPAVVMGDSEVNDMPWITKTKWRHLEWIAANYKNGNQVTNEQMPGILNQATSIFNLSQGLASGEVAGALVVELYIKPNREYPNGLFITAANGVELQKSDYKFDNYHLEHIKDIEVPGVFFGMATLEAAIPLQKTWNRTVSSLATFNEKNAKGKGLAPRGAEMECMPDDNHGEWLEYTPVMGLKPEVMSTGTVPRTYEIMLNIVRKSLEDLFSQHEVTSGTNASDIRSGSMVSLLLEQDASGMIPSHATFEEGIERLAQRILKRIQKGYTQSRVLKITGREGEYDIFSFIGTDLRNNTDVTVKRESSLPDSRIARQAQILERYDKGLYGDPQDPEVRREVMNLLEDAVVENIYDADRLDEANAAMENDLFRQGQVDNLIPNVYDNHGIHAKSLTRFLKSKDIQKLKFDDPERFKAINLKAMAHLQMHVKFINEQREQAVKEAANAKR